VTVTVLTVPDSTARRRVPDSGLVGELPIEPGTALGALFAPAPDVGTEAAMGRHVATAPARLLRELAPATTLLPPHERERAAVLTSWVQALLATAIEADAPEQRMARLHRSAYLVARALAGEPSDSPFVRAFAAEALRRSFTRSALDALLAAARRRVESPRAGTREEWARSSRDLATAFVTALFGAAPTPATVDAASALHRLLVLRDLSAALPSGRVRLPAEDLHEPLQFRTPMEIGVAVESECEAIRPLLLRGVRALAEAPLTFRRLLSYLLTVGVHLLSEIEVHPEAMAGRVPRLGWWTRSRALWQARREPLV
jgi:phytoene/squalene synthetase